MNSKAELSSMKVRIMEMFIMEKDLMNCGEYI